jgi:hypothetical protein
MSEITRVGVNLAKSVIQVNAVDAGGILVTIEAGVQMLSGNKKADIGEHVPPFPNFLPG